MLQKPVLRPFLVWAGCVLLLFLAVGCGTGAGRILPPTQKTTGSAGFSLRIQPASGPAGSKVNLVLRLGSGIRFPVQPGGGSPMAPICWGRCGTQGRWWPVLFRQTGKREYQASSVVPGVVNGVLLPTGTYTVRLACVTGSPDCAAHPEASASFHLTASLPAKTVQWASLAAGGGRSLPELGGLNQSTAVDPTDPGRRAQCQGALLQGGQPVGAYLKVSGPHPLQATLSPAVFGDAHGYVGCRALALDPGNPNVIYAAGIDDMGGAYPMAFPPPVYTTDGGQSWRDVPAPAGFPADSAGADFIGFQADGQGVTAWFSAITTDHPYAPGQVLGERTVDGGLAWTTVSPQCPTAGPCAWRLPPLPYNTANLSQFAPYLLLVSPDQGSQWRPAVFAGHRLWGGHAYVDPAGDILLSGAGCIPFQGGGPACPSYLPLLLSRDGGITWRWVQLPPPPGGWWQTLYEENPMPPVGYSGLLLTKDGSLAVAVKAWGEKPWFSWRVLHPGSSTWTIRRGRPPGLLP